jgi:hypothetical protein
VGLDARVDKKSRGVEYVCLPRLVEVLTEPFLVTLAADMPRKVRLDAYQVVVVDRRVATFGARYPVVVLDTLAVGVVVDVKRRLVSLHLDPPSLTVTVTTPEVNDRFPKYIFIFDLHHM